MVDARKRYRQIKGESRTCQEFDFDNITDKLQTEHLDRYEGVQGEIHQVSQFDEFSAVSTKYSGKVNMPGEDAFKVQELFSLAFQSTTIGTSLDGTVCKMLLDGSATGSFMF